MRYLKTQATSKKGINHIKSIIKQTGCKFHTIHQENDIGIDAIIELFHDGQSTGRLICLQIKSGDSFYCSASGKCKIFIGKHREYWVNNSLPVFGVVYIPSLFCAFMIDIKKFLLQETQAKYITFPALELNQLDFEKFSKIVKGEFSLIVSYFSEFEKITDIPDFSP